jgi:hypothetical protein
MYRKPPSRTSKDEDEDHEKQRCPDFIEDDLEVTLGVRILDQGSRTAHEALFGGASDDGVALYNQERELGRMWNRRTTSSNCASPFRA